MKTSVLLAFFFLVLVLSACGGLSEADEHYNAGVELQEQERLEEAIGEYGEAIRLNPQLTEAYNNRGNAYADLGQFERAIQDYGEAIRLNPQLI
ncbi:tetratricopeptide repeat protein, partial [Chloroflexota bacterium]